MHTYTSLVPSLGCQLLFFCMLAIFQHANKRAGSDWEQGYTYTINTAVIGYSYTCKFTALSHYIAIMFVVASLRSCGWAE